MILDKAIRFIFSRPAIPSRAHLAAFEYPPWLAGVDGRAGAGELEALLGVAVPGALLEFWTHPGLLARAAGYFDHYDFASERPRVYRWGGKPFLLFAHHYGHAGGVLAVTTPKTLPRLGP